MITSTGKIKRAKIAGFLTKSGANREKIKALIKYPRTESLRIGATATGATLRVKTRSADGTIRDMSSTLNSEVSGTEIEIDPSESGSELLIEISQPGAAWSSEAFIVEAKYKDGSISRHEVFSSLSGDGGGEAVPVSITSKMPPPDGWPTF